MAFKFQGVDFIEFDSLLSENERMVRDTTRSFIEDNVIPIIEECNRAGRFPRELVKPMGEMGFYGATIDGYGCPGISNVEYGLLMQELERGDSGIRSFVSVQSALAYVSDLDLRLGRAEKLLAAKTGNRREDRLLCTHRAGLRFQSRRHAHPCPERRRQLPPQRRKDVDYIGFDCRCRRRMGQARR